MASESRERLLDAVVDVLADGGLDALSMRTVASTAGVSVASVQYHFGAKEQLVAAGFEHLAADYERDVAVLDRTGSASRVLASTIDLWLPYDERRARRSRVWLAFTSAAATSPSLRAIAASTDRELRAAYAAGLRAGQESGEFRSDLDPDAEGARLMALVDGLVLQALMLSKRRRRGFLDPLIRGRLEALRADRSPTKGMRQ